MTTYKLTPGIASCCDVSWIEDGRPREITAIWHANKAVDSQERELRLPFAVLEELTLHFTAQFMLPYGERGKVTPWEVEAT